MDLFFKKGMKQSFVFGVMLLTFFYSRTLAWADPVSIDDLESVLGDLKNESKEIQADNENLIIQIKDLNREIQFLEEELPGLDLESNKLKALLDNLQQTYDQKEEEISLLKAKHHHLGQELEQLKDARSKINNEISQNSQAQNPGTVSVEILNEEIAQVKEQLRMAKGSRPTTAFKQKHKINEDIQFSQRRQQQLQKQLTDLNNQLRLDESRVNELDGTHKRLKQQLMQVENEASDKSRAKVAPGQERILNRFNAEMKDLELTIQAYSKLLKEFSSINDELKNKFPRDIKILEKDLNTLRIEQKDLLDQRVLLEKQFMLKEKLPTIQSRIKESQELLSKNENKLQQLKKEGHNLKQQLAQIESKNKNMDQEILSEQVYHPQPVNRQRANTEKTLEHVETETQRVKEQLKILKQTNVFLKQDLARLKSEAEGEPLPVETVDISNEIESLKLQEKEFKTIIKDIKKSYDSRDLMWNSRSEEKRLSEYLSILKGENTELLQEVDELNETLNQ